jgi:hypothetical protein
MKFLPATFLVVCGVALQGVGRAEEVRPAKRGSETSAWLADLQARWESAYKKRVVEAFQNGLQEAKAQYDEQIRLGLADAERVGDKRDAGVFLEELERLKSEEWQMPVSDQDTTLAYLRMSRRIYRERLVELDRHWDAEVRRLRLEFDAALVEGARQLMARNLVEEVRRVQAERQALILVWAPRTKERYSGVRRVASVQAGSQAAPQQAGNAPVSQNPTGARRALVDAVRWVLAGKGKLTVLKAERKLDLERVEDLPLGRVEFVSVELDREKFGRALLPGELLHLAQFRGVQSFSLLKFQVGPEDLSFLAGWSQLRSLTLEGVTVNPQVGRWLSHCSQLRVLELRKSQGLTAEFFRELAAGISVLRSMDLEGSKMEDSVAVELAHQEKLATLSLLDTGLTAAIFPALSGLKNLRELRLCDGPLPGLERLIPLQLESFGPLNTSDPNFVGQIAVLGASFPKLRKLELSGSKLSAEHAEALVTHLKQLRELSLGYSVVPVPGAAKALSKLRHLEQFICCASDLGDEVFTELLEIRSLKGLDLGHTGVTDACVRSVDSVKLKGLTSLNVRDTKVTQATVDELSKRFRNLKVSRELCPQ